MQYIGYLRRNPNDTPDSVNGLRLLVDEVESVQWYFVNGEM